MVNIIVSCIDSMTVDNCLIEPVLKRFIFVRIYMQALLKMAKC